LELWRVVSVTEVIEAGLFVIPSALKDVRVANGGGLDFLSVGVVNLEFPIGCDMVIFDYGSIGIQVPSPKAPATFKISMQVCEFILVLRYIFL
jgi:hypothetical protein